MLTDLSPVSSLSAGLLIGAGVMAVVAWLFRRRWAEAEHGRQRIEAVAVKAREILAAAPDGLFIWDREQGAITCSRKLAALLSLADGGKSRFEDVVERFDDESVRRLNAAVTFLHEEGRGFELVLSTADSGGRRLIQAIGGRAFSKHGEVLADMVWMRDVSVAAKLLVDLTGDGDLPEARDLHLRGMLDALPFPVWLRDGDLKVVFTNQAALSQRVAGPDESQAASAQAENRPIARQQQIADAGEDRVFSVTECPLGDDDVAESGTDSTAARAPSAGVIGYAFPVPAAVDESAPMTEPAAGDSDLSETSASAASPLPRAETVLAGLGTGIAIFDQATRLSFHNPAYREMWRLDADWLERGREFGEILEHLRAVRRLPEVPDFRAYKMEQLQLFDDVGDATGDLMHLPDGRTLRAVSFALPGGGLAISYDDVTDQLDLESAVNARDAVHRATLENLREAVAVFGSDGRLKLSNPSFARFWRLDAEALGVDVHVADFIESVRHLIDPAGDWETQKAQIHAAMTRRGPTRARIPLADGRVVEYTNAPLPDGGVLVSYLDVGGGPNADDAAAAAVPEAAPAGPASE